MTANESNEAAPEERPFTILIVDNDSELCRSIVGSLSSRGRDVMSVPNGTDAVDLMGRRRVDLVFLDNDSAMPDSVDILRRIKHHDKGTTVMVMSGCGTVEDAVNALKNGAEEFVAKPLSPEKMERLVRSVEQQRNARRVVSSEQGRPREEYRTPPLITANPAMLRTMEVVGRIAPLPTTVLIEGESGTGKELIARNLHNLSDRAHERFIALNCAALPENLLESELFGHERGAFTGADARKIGYFEAAAGGTILLDEIAEMTMDLQAKLLRVIQERTLRRVGSVEEIPTDVRIIAATNQNLERAAADGRFRKDLYYRINVVTIRVPPLRERPEDIPLLCQYFLDRYAKRFGKSVVGVDLAVLERFQSYRWEGNVRELQNVMEQLVAMGTDSEIHLSDLPEGFFRREFKGRKDRRRLKPFQAAKSDFETDYLVRAMEQSEGNITLAARLAGMSRQSFYDKLARNGIAQYPFRHTEPTDVA